MQVNPLTSDDAIWRRQILAAAVAAACRKALVNAGWAICLLSCTNGRSLVGSQFRALTIERSLMSGCVQGLELTENVSIKF